MKSKIIILAATANNNVLGKDNTLIWHLPKDLKRFKALTLNSPIIMGRKTYESIGRPLPKRHNIVLSRNKNLSIEGVTIVHSLEQALEITNQQEKVFIIGGGQIYTEALPLADSLEITKVYHHFEGDTYFPTIDNKQWELQFREHFLKDEKHKYDYTFMTFKKVANS